MKVPLWDVGAAICYSDDIICITAAAGQWSCHITDTFILKQDPGGTLGTLPQNLGSDQCTLCTLNPESEPVSQPVTMISPIGGAPLRGVGVASGSHAWWAILHPAPSVGPLRRFPRTSSCHPPHLPAFQILSETSTVARVSRSTSKS